jgi:hypothetical protein
MPLSDEGPYLSIALLCEKVLEEKDGVRSFIRVVDRITASATGPEPPTELIPFNVQLIGAFVLKAGEARGRYALKLRPHDPSGHAMGEAEVPINFSGPANHGWQHFVPVNLQVEHEGIYWFDVLFVDPRAETEEVLTRLPLEILYQPQRTGGP